MRLSFIGLASGLVVACASVEPTSETEPIAMVISADMAADVSEIRLEDTGPLSDDTLPSSAQIATFGELTAFIGKTFKGIPGGGGPEAQADIQKWSWALGGSAILIQHALEDGSYGGDTYVYQDAATGDLVYVYITNAGFRTEGTITITGIGTYVAEEAVAGHPSITMVRSTSQMQPDGSTSVASEYQENGIWMPGHSFTYEPTGEPLPALVSPTLPE